MINKVTLIGRAGQDAELVTFSNGGKVAKFTMATSESYKDQSGEWQEQTQWHNVVLKGKSVDSIAERLKKGMLVYVEGKVTYRSYEKDGETKYITEIMAFICRSLQKSEGSDSNVRAQTADAGNNIPAQQPADDDDLPF